MSIKRKSTEEKEKEDKEKKKKEKEEKKHKHKQQLSSLVSHLEWTSVQQHTPTHLHCDKICLVKQNLNFCCAKILLRYC